MRGVAIGAATENPAGRDLRTFGVTMLLALGVLGGLSWWLASPAGAGRPIAVVLWLLGLGNGLLAWRMPRVGWRVYGVWMTAAAWLGAVMTLILLTVLFVVLLPVFTFIRLGDPLRKRAAGGSYWEDHRREDPSLERALRPF